MKRLLAAVACLAMLLTVSAARGMSCTIPGEFTFYYPEDWTFSDTAFRHTSRDNYFWLCFAFDKRTCLAAEKTEMRSRYGYLDLADALPEEFESVKADFLLRHRGGSYLETVVSSADGTPFLVYSYTDSAWAKGAEHKSLYYQGVTLIGGWAVFFTVYGNQPAGVRRDADDNDLRVLRNALSSFRLLAPPMLKAESFFYSVQDGNAAIHGYFGPETALAVPAAIDGHPVTEIGGHAFAGCARLTEIILPGSVTGIDDYAFSACARLKSISIPVGVKKIPPHAFYACSNLTGVGLPGTVTEIGRAAFSGCGKLESVTIPAGVTTIGDEAFYGCRALESIAIPADVTSIGLDAFELCGSLRDIVVHPDNRVYVSVDGILYGKGGKTLLDCPEGKTGKITVPSGVAAIGAEAFTYCDVSEVILQYGVTKIGTRAFDICKNLTAVEIPMSVTSIPDDAFGGCGQLTIYGYDRHPARKYAEKHGIPFVAIPPASEITLQCGGGPVTGGALAIDLASGCATLAISAAVQPSGARGGVTWKSSAPLIAAVDAAGLVTGLKPGAATVTATAADGSRAKASIKVTVTYLAREINITGSSTLRAGRQTTLKATVLPAETVNKRVTWASSDTAVAAVSAAGLVTSGKVTETRTAVITATARDGGGAFAEFVITVTP